MMKWKATGLQHNAYSELRREGVRVASAGKPGAKEQDPLQFALSLSLLASNQEPDRHPPREISPVDNVHRV